MVRPVLFALLLILIVGSPVLASQGVPTPTRSIPASVNEPATPVAVPSRPARRTRPSTPEPGPVDQPGLFASDADLLARDPTGPFLRGHAGQIAVVGVYPDDSGNDVLVALRNNTEATVHGVELTATLRDGADPIGLGLTTDIAPATIVPGGLAFALVTLEGANGRLSDDNLPHIDVRQTDSNTMAPAADLRVTSASVDEDGVTAAIAVDSGAVSAFQMVVVCVRQAGPHYVRVSDWSSSVTLYEVRIQAGDTTTLETSAPTDCGDRYIVTVASY